MFRIRENRCPIDETLYTYVTYYRLPNDSTIALQEIIEKLLRELKCSYIDVNIIRDTVKIMELLEMSEKENSLAVAYPHLVQEWNFSKNGTLKPEYISGKSNKKVWWICVKGHEWQAAVYSRTSGTGCPQCYRERRKK